METSLLLMAAGEHYAPWPPAVLLGQCTASRAGKVQAELARLLLPGPGTC